MFALEVVLKHRMIHESKVAELNNFQMKEDVFARHI